MATCQVFESGQTEDEDEDNTEEDTFVYDENLDNFDFNDKDLMYEDFDENDITEEFFHSELIKCHLLFLL